MRDSTIVMQLEKIEKDMQFLYQSSLVTSMRMQAMENLFSRRFSLIILAVVNCFVPGYIKECIKDEEEIIRRAK